MCTWSQAWETKTKPTKDVALLACVASPSRFLDCPGLNCSRLHNPGSRPLVFPVPNYFWPRMMIWRAMQQGNPECFPGATKRTCSHVVVISQSVFWKVEKSKRPASQHGQHVLGLAGILHILSSWTSCFFGGLDHFSDKLQSNGLNLVWLIHSGGEIVMDFLRIMGSYKDSSRHHRQGQHVCGVWSVPVLQGSVYGPVASEYVYLIIIFP